MPEYTLNSCASSEKPAVEVTRGDLLIIKCRFTWQTYCTWVSKWRKELHDKDRYINTHTCIKGSLSDIRDENVRSMFQLKGYLHTHTYTHSGQWELTKSGVWKNSNVNYEKLSFVLPMICTSISLHYYDTLVWHKASNLDRYFRSAEEGGGRRDWFLASP